MLYSYLCRINTARERDRSHVSRQTRDMLTATVIYIVITILTATTASIFYTFAQHYMRRLRRRLRRAVPGGGGGGVMTNPDVMLKYF